MSAITLKADMRIQTTPELALRERRGERLVLVKSVPLTIFVDVHERQCQSNHQQTLERIRERGGFSAGEAVCVLSCLHWSDLQGMSEAHAHHVLYEMIAAHNRGMRVAERAAIPTSGEEMRLREAPWGQCKVAFFDDGEPDCDVERVWDAFGPGKDGKLPVGWEFCESGISGAAGFYVLFDVEGVPDPRDGATVRNALADLGFMSRAALTKGAE